jgi:hypothetical protein
MTSVKKSGLQAINVIMSQNMFEAGTMRLPMIELHKTMLKPIVMYRRETWSKIGQNKFVLNMRRRKPLKKVYGAVTE